MANADKSDPRPERPSVLARILSSRARAEIFRLLFGQAGATLHLREIQRRSGLNVRTVQRELMNLEELGLVVRTEDGNRVYFKADRFHPLYGEIRGLVRKTSGLNDVLREALEDPGVEWAFLFGSVARGEETGQSDIDLMVVGDVGLREVVKRLSGVADRVGREINPHALSRAEWVRRLKAGDPFVTRVAAAPKTFVVGNPDDFERMG